MNWINQTIIILSLHGIVLSIAIVFYSSHSRQSNLMLAASVFIISLDAGLPKAANVWSSEWPHLILSSLPLLFLFGPLVLGYIDLLINKRLPKYYFANFIPFAAAVCWMAPFFTASGTEKLMYLDRIRHEGLSQELFFLLFFRNIHFMIYLTVASVKLSRYSRTIRNEFSGHQVIVINWLWFLVRCLVISAGIFFILFLAAFLGYRIEKNWPEFLCSSLLLIIVYLIGYRGFRQPAIFSISNIGDEKKYNKSGLQAEVASKYKQKLVDVMDTLKPYRNSELSLTELADMLQVSPNHLSQIINDHFKQNFYDFINRYRVEEFQKNIMLNKSRFTILGLAFEVGFNSKSAFYKAFQKHSRITPTQFIRKIKTQK